MPQQIENDDINNEDSNLEIHDSTSVSKNKSRETEPEAVLKTKAVVEKSFTERWKTHRFWLVRGTYYVLYSVWMIVMVIAGFIAWLVSLLFI